MDAEADRLWGAKRSEQGADWVHTRAGEVKLGVPKRRVLPFETELVERYRQAKRSKLNEGMK